MPTGYTCIIEDDPEVTLRTFALRCARAFLFHQSDENVAQPPRNQELDGRLEVDLEKANIQLDLRLSMTDAQAEADSRGEYVQEKKAIEKYEVGRRERTERFTKMRTEVIAWTPPEALESLKAFMLEQIAGELFERYPVTAPRQLSGREWRNDQVKRALEEVERCQKKIAKDAELCRETNAWIAALYAALPPGRDEKV